MPNQKPNLPSVGFNNQGPLSVLTSPNPPPNPPLPTPSTHPILPTPPQPGTRELRDTYVEKCKDFVCEPVKPLIGGGGTSWRIHLT
jgi:hypothetical protein